VVIGTRPEAIKLAPVAQALRAIGISPWLVFTGQHPIDPRHFGLDGFSLRRLDCRGQGDPHLHVGAVTKALLPVMAPAGLVLVQGDTSSALGGALAAELAGVPAGHIEAGLRSHDRHRPWPEEEFRIAIDARAELLFAPTELSVANLRREHVRGRIFLTGNTGIDAALSKRTALSRERTGGGQSRLLVTCHRRESWGAGLASIAGAVRRLARERIATIDLILHPNPAVAAQMRLLLGREPDVRLHSPCTHSDLLQGMLESDLVLSDSGGIQEEAAALGIPLLVLRERTERPEAIGTGHLALAGLNAEGIFEAARRMLARGSVALGPCPYGDGKASPRIAAIVAEWLVEQSRNGALLEPDQTSLSKERRQAT
jgi:UDP-N-acetylglucosamine 2-epimerase (non-hydrolysing)